MGCSSSTSTAVRPLRAEEANRAEDETGSKPDSRGDSAVSKGTTDSGVVMESAQIPALPGQVPRQLPPLPCVGENVRPKSSEILEELLSQGIIPVGQRCSAAGEAYSIVLDDREGARRKPPSRLESLKASKTQSVPSREKFEEKMRLAEKRRKLREDELVTRLRIKSARVRAPAPAPASGSELDEDPAVTPVERIQHPHTADPQEPPLFSQVTREEAEGEEQRREEEGEAAGDGSGKCRADTDGAEDGERRRRSEDGEREKNEEEEEEEEEEETQVEELENDSSFLRAHDKEEFF